MAGTITTYIAINRPITLKDGTEIKKGKYNDVEGDFSDNKKIADSLYYIGHLPWRDYYDIFSKEYSWVYVENSSEAMYLFDSKGFESDELLQKYEYDIKYEELTALYGKLVDGSEEPNRPYKEVIDDVFNRLEIPRKYRPYFPIADKFHFTGEYDIEILRDYE